ncbi:MAG: glycosyltransferase family 9 protein [Porticoccaceae bacterium]
MKHDHLANTILIFRIGSMGDTLVALPAFHLVREQYPDSHIVLLTNTPEDGGVKAPPSHQILMDSGLVDDYIEYPHRKMTVSTLLELIRSLRKLRPAVGIYLMPRRTLGQRLRDAIFFALTGIWRVHGLWLGRHCNVPLPVSGMPEYREAEASRLLRTLGYDPALLEQRLFSLNLQPTERESIQPLLQELGTARPFIAFGVGTKVPANDWGQDRWLELIRHLRTSAKSHALVFLGSADEWDQCQQLLDCWPQGGLNLCGKLSPRQNAAVYERAALFVGLASGPAHLASSVGIPCVSIASARNKPGIWFPFGNEANVFYNLVPCNGCRLSVCIEREMICIRSIRPIDVAERVLSLLDQPIREMRDPLRLAAGV